jgi:gamma-glutamylcysteine synthetase
MLSAAYDSHLANLQRSLQDTAAEDLEKEHLASDTASGSTDVQVELTPYDFHQVVKMQGHEAVRYDMGTRIRDVVRSRKRFGWTAVERDTGRMVKVQQGTYRVNCLDW